MTIQSRGDSRGTGSAMMAMKFLGLASAHPRKEVLLRNHSLNLSMLIRDGHTIEHRT